MGLVSKSIPNLINGISQQPPSLRLSTQGEVQENGLSDIVDGLKKRPPTKFLKKLVKCKSNWVVSAAGSAETLSQGNLTSSNTEVLSTADLAAASIQTYKRSGEEQYTVVILPHASAPTILVYDILGNLRYQSGKSSWLADGTTIVYGLASEDDVVVYKYGNSDDTSYLVGTGGTVLNSNDIATTSVADATFILNTKKIVALDTDLIQPKKNGHSALVFLKSTNYGRSYKLKLESKDINANSSLTGEANVAQSPATSGGGAESLLKVSTVIGQLKTNLAASSSTNFATSGQAAIPAKRVLRAHYWGNEEYGAALYEADLILELMSITIPDSVYNADPTKMLITIGGDTVPYDPVNVYSDDLHVEEKPYRHTIPTFNGWVYQTTSSPYKIWLPKNYVIRDTTYSGWRAFDRASTFIDNITNPTQTDIVLKPIHSDGDDNYFIIHSPEGGVLKDFDLRASDDDGGSNLRVFKDVAKSFTDLPSQCIDGYRLGVVGDNNKNEDDFHVVFKGGAGSGYWKESVGYDLENYYDLATMPHLLRQDPDKNGSLHFSFGRAAWDERKAGDNNTNPSPSFVGQTITDIFFHRNRLGLLSGENVIFSEAGSYFNFYRTTVRTLLDADPIDVAVSQNEVSELKAALPIQDALLLFSELNQFTLTSSQLLTPAEVTIDQSTKFECDLTATPVSAGNSAFFATKGGNYAGVREYFTEGDTEIKDATLVTAHVPEYLEGSMRKMVASTNENMLVCLTTDNHKEAYIYKWYNQGNQRVQSAWSKWIFDTDVVDISFNNSNLYITFGDGRFETMAVRTDAPKLAFSSLVSEPITTYFTANLESSQTTGFGTDNTFTPPRASLNASADRLGERAALLMGSVGSTRFIEFSSMDKETVSLTINGTTFLPANATFTENGASGWKYVYRWGTSQVPISFLEGLVGQASNITSQVSVGLGLDGKSHDVLLDHRTRLEHSSATPITSLADVDTYLTSVGIDPSFTGVTDNYNNTVTFVNFRGEIVAKSVDSFAKLAVRNYLYNTGTGVAKTHVENETTVNNYLFVGEPYTFKYTVSEQVFEPTDGDNTSLARFQLRNMTFNFNNTGTFNVVNETLGRPPAYSNFTGRLLGQVDNIIGYTAVVDTGNHTVNIQSQASNAKITISNDTHLPSTFQSAEWEGYVVLRNKRL